MGSSFCKVGGISERSHLDSKPFVLLIAFLPMAFRYISGDLARVLSTAGYTDKLLDAAVDNRDDAVALIGELVLAGHVFGEAAVVADALLAAVEAGRQTARRLRKRTA